MKKSFFLTAVLFCLISNFCFAEEAKNSSPFKLDLTKDSILLGTSLALTGTDFILSDILNLNQKEFDGQLLNKNNVNNFDKLAINPYSKKLNYAGTAACGLGALMPAVCAAAPVKDWLTVGTMYAETLLFAWGTKDLLKLCVNRERPYMYFDNFPTDKVTEGDWDDSFPSGHTTLAFAGASFASYVFSVYFPESNWKWAVIGGSSAVALGTAALRVASGNHFTTDVITGAIIGTASGILIPLIHQDFGNSKTKITTAFNGSGINFQINL